MSSVSLSSPLAGRFACWAVLVLAALSASGCIPYTMGTTAQPVQPNELSTYSALTFVPAGAATEYDTDANDDETVAYPLPSTGFRFGIDGASDVGLRAPGLGGIVIDYKRRVAGDSLGQTTALALVGGAGVLNGGNHAHVEASLLVSGPERNAVVTPYGGLRAMYTIPLSDVAVSDEPTLGGFAGVRVGNGEVGISPEVGVFYDPSALGLRDYDVIVVPAVTVHGVLSLFDLL